MAPPSIPQWPWVGVALLPATCPHILSPGVVYVYVLGGGGDDCFPFLGSCPRWALARAVGIALATPQASSSPEVTSIWRSYNGRRREATKVSLLEITLPPPTTGVFALLTFSVFGVLMGSWHCLGPHWLFRWATARGMAACGKLVTSSEPGKLALLGGQEL